MKVGQVFTGTVRDLASDGRGVVVNPDGKTFFAAGVWPGEKGEFRVTGLKGRVGFAKLLTLDMASANSKRVTPACQYHGIDDASCGGCPWMFMDYEEQLNAKQQRVAQAMQRLDAVASVQPIIGSAKTLGYRNRAQFKSNGPKLGYVALASNNLVDVAECPVLTPHNNTTLKDLRVELPNNAWRPKSKQQWVTLDIDESVTASNASVNARLPFQQGNDQQNKVMQDWLAGMLETFPTSLKVLELFCGSGNLTKIIAAAGFTKITAVEVIDTALEQLREQDLAGVEVLACDIYNEYKLGPVRVAFKKHDVLVLDPPRDGLKTLPILMPGKPKFKHIFYVSCDLPTFTRDAGVLIEKGYKLNSVQPLDMFPQTQHIELMAHFSL
ncbi:class I SAM-dependent RNA methyltransferase [Teredinibacter waterburyi]|uniref:class I SAM-dependent RNA methyltransferase n=1 Tax=Teredinibacter waterburyi TaxID=1500538 RepID=UPI00165F2648|nr:class I SAM-dependent RNA methyltransferase [Teredinibacter waterburyi]